MYGITGAVSSGKNGIQIFNPAGFTVNAQHLNYKGGGWGGGSTATGSFSGPWRAPSLGGGWRKSSAAGGWRPPTQGGYGAVGGVGGSTATMRLLAQKLASLAVPAQGPGIQQGMQRVSPGHGWNPWTGEYRAPDVPTV